MTVDSPALKTLAEELRTIAAFGLNFATNPYDRERFEAVLSVSARLQALAEGMQAEDLLQLYAQDGFSLSAMPSVEVVVMDQEKILLVQRRDDDLWALPGGITDPGETLAESALRELQEETGLEGRIQSLLGVFDSRLWQSDKRIHFYHFLFMVETENLVPKASDDVIAAAFFAEDHLPPLSCGHHTRVPFVLKQLRGEAPIPFFDSPS